jgi:hypothetical protein
MSDAERFRRLAEQYEKAAAKTTDKKERAEQRKLARTWANFARKAAAREERKTRSDTH